MQQTYIFQTRSVYWVNLQLMISIDWQAQDFEVYYYLQLADTVKNIVNNILLCIIQEQCSNQDKSQSKC